MAQNMLMSYLHDPYLLTIFFRSECIILFKSEWNGVTLFCVLQALLTKQFIKVILCRSHLLGIFCHKE